MKRITGRGVWNSPAMRFSAPMRCSRSSYTCEMVKMSSSLSKWMLLMIVQHVFEVVARGAHRHVAHHVLVAHALVGEDARDGARQRRAGQRGQAGQQPPAHELDQRRRPSRFSASRGRPRQSQARSPCSTGS